MAAWSRPVQVLQILYDMDIISEEACEAWAGEKEHADEEVGESLRP